MIQAAPLVLSFARAVPMLNRLVGAIGITELGNRVNNYIQENPEESAKIVSMIMPAQGIANALKNKSSEDVEEVQESEIFINKEKISLEDLDEMTDEEAADLPDEDKAELMKQAGKKRDRELSIATSEKLGLSGPGKEKIDIEREIDERVDPGGIQKEKKGYDFRDYIPKGAYKKRYADGGAIGIEVLFEEKKPRKNFFMGGPALEGQALAIYNSMNAYGFDDQAIANALTEQGLYGVDNNTNNQVTTVQDVINQNANPSGSKLEQALLNPLKNKSKFNLNAPIGINRNDKTFIDPLNEKIANQMITQNPNLNKYTTEEIVSMNPDIFDIKTDKGFIGNTIDNFKTMGGNLIDKFSGSKVGQGATKFKNFAITPMMALMQKRNPLNPNAMNYNPNLQKQMDFLEGQTGTRVFGTSDNLQFEDAAMIGRDPNSGLAKYGPGSVLSGQNVVSGFGTNDYEQQLANYISKMRNYKTLTNFQKEKLEQAKAEVAKEIARREQETADRARAANPGVYARADAMGFTDGKGGGFGSKSTGTNESFSNKSGRGRTGYSEGGLATMFKEKR